MLYRGSHLQTLLKALIHAQLIWPFVRYPAGTLTTVMEKKKKEEVNVVGDISLDDVIWISACGCSDNWKLRQQSPIKVISCGAVFSETRCVKLCNKAFIRKKKGSPKMINPLSNTSSSIELFLKIVTSIFHDLLIFFLKSALHRLVSTAC